MGREKRDRGGREKKELEREISKRERESREKNRERRRMESVVVVVIT